MAHSPSIMVIISSDWTDKVQAVGAILVPIVVAGLAYALTRNQSRSEAMVKARLDYYQLLVPDLNRLMCYITFIGGWRDEKPESMISLKRRLDANFYCAAPLFGKEVLDAYEELMKLSFRTFNMWGEDAKIISNTYRRRQSWLGEGLDIWQDDWSRYFAPGYDDSVSAESLTSYRKAYDKLVASLVRDIDLTRARSQYTTGLVSLNAHAPKAEDIPGSPGSEARQSGPGEP